MADKKKGLLNCIDMQLYGLHSVKMKNVASLLGLLLVAANGYELVLNTGVTSNSFQFLQPDTIVGFWTGVGISSQGVVDPDSSDPAVLLAYSIPCPETQYVSQLTTHYELQLQNDPGGTLAIETRVRLANASLIYVDTPLVTTLATDSADFYTDENFYSNDISNTTIVCPGGSLMLLESRMTCNGCTPPFGYITLFTYLTSTITFLDMRLTTWSSGKQQLTAQTSDATSFILDGGSTDNSLNVLDPIRVHATVHKCHSSQRLLAFHVSIHALVNATFDQAVTVTVGLVRYRPTEALHRTSLSVHDTFFLPALGQIATSSLHASSLVEACDAEEELTVLAQVAMLNATLDLPATAQVAIVADLVYA